MESSDGDTHDTDLNEKLLILQRLVNNYGQPNPSVINAIARDLDFIKLNIKFFGYELATRMAEALPPRSIPAPIEHPLTWKPTTQADLESDWAAYWLNELKIGFIYHRKLWEIVYLLQALHNYRLIRPGARGLGFGCGNEPFPSYFANAGVNVTITDLEPSNRQSIGWAETGQHASTLESSFVASLVKRDDFLNFAELIYVDMNHIPNTLREYDFCWSICALEHLGSIEKGLAFVENAMDTLRPGGVAVHTTEFNFYDDNTTIDNWGCVFFQRKHFLDLANRLRAKGYEIPEVSFDLGSGPLDRFIDLPPYSHQVSQDVRKMWITEQHLKLAHDGVASTCYGLIIRKPM
ncbi:methyltransferase family protein [Roseiarcus fermentans]|uniref:Methyltransferase family protein n=1 Tax=Roseiarcus fermentans TaxID=1473586 RepID=A0A366FPC9_9HYPH|nr:methyltransferase domain-containing protein [Roseiarcus fermentans]RBP15910.1 methyltransferase family protein [Roseiarcus fermentans]